MPGLIWLFGQGGVDADITLETVVAQITMETPTLAVSVNPVPDTVVASVSIDTPTVTGDANAIAGGPANWLIDDGAIELDEVGYLVDYIDGAPFNIAVVTVFPPVIITGADIDLTLTTVSVGVSIPTPTVSATRNVSITLVTVSASVNIPTPTVTTAAVVLTVITSRYRAPVGYKSRRMGSRLPRGSLEHSVRI